MDYVIITTLVLLSVGVYGVPFPFSHGDNGSKYVGCFYGVLDYSIKRDQFTSVNMTIDTCLAACSLYGANTLAGLSTSRCTCLDPINPAAFVQWYNYACYFSNSFKCAGNRLQICGSGSWWPWRMSLYCAHDSGCAAFFAEFGNASCYNCAECEPRYGECTGPCNSDSLFGPFCLHKLIGCPPYNYGDECQFWCGGCNEESCNVTTGNCLQGCKENFINTQCTDCAPGWKGKLCDKKCSVNCATCQRNSGECISCADGYYGDDCDACPVHCENQQCQQGKCSNCKVGFYGEYCELPCYLGCMTCNFATGECEQCYPGYYNHGTTCVQCQASCKNRICDVRTGECDIAGTSTNNSAMNVGLYAAIGVLGGMVVVLAVGFIMFVILRRKKAAAEQALETTILSTENRPDDAVYEEVQENQRSIVGGSAMEASQRTTLATRPSHATNRSAGATNEPARAPKPSVRAAKPSTHSPKPSTNSPTPSTHAPKPPVLKKPIHLGLQSVDESEASNVPPSSPARRSSIHYENAAFSDDAEGNYHEVNVDDIDVRPTMYDRLDRRAGQLNGNSEEECVDKF